MILLDDITRCHDSKCKEKLNCERFIQRKARGINIRHILTLKWRGLCIYKITHCKLQ